MDIATLEKNADELYQENNSISERENFNYYDNLEFLSQHKGKDVFVVNTLEDRMIIQLQQKKKTYNLPNYVFEGVNEEIQEELKENFNRQKWNLLGMLIGMILIILIGLSIYHNSKKDYTEKETKIKKIELEKQKDLIQIEIEDLKLNLQKNGNTKL